MNEEVVSLADQDKQEVFMEARLLDQAWGMWDSEEASGGEDQSQAPQMLEDHDDIRRQVKAAIDQHWLAIDQSLPSSSH